MILSKSSINGSPQSNEISETYTEYDNKDRVRNVFPPGSSTSTPNLIFNYLYDGTDNMIYKKVPDQGGIDMIYNNQDLMTFYRDNNLTVATSNENGIANQWMMTKYDNFGRPTGSGFYTSASFPAVENAETLFIGQKLNITMENQRYLK